MNSSSSAGDQTKQQQQQQQQRAKVDKGVLETKPWPQTELAVAFFDSRRKWTIWFYKTLGLKSHLWKLPGWSKRALIFFCSHDSKFEQVHMVMYGYFFTWPLSVPAKLANLFLHRPIRKFHPCSTTTLTITIWLQNIIMRLKGYKGAGSLVRMQNHSEI